MPLFYYARQSQIATKEGVKTWHLSLKKVGKVVDTQLLAESIAEKSSLTPGDVQNVIRNLMSTMRMHLLNSRTVRLNGLGTFTMKARTRGKGTEKSRRCKPESSYGVALPVYPGIYASGGYWYYSRFVAGRGV